MPQWSLYVCIYVGFLDQLFLVVRTTNINVHVWTLWQCFPGNRRLALAAYGSTSQEQEREPCAQHAVSLSSSFPLEYHWLFGGYGGLTGEGNLLSYCLLGFWEYLWVPKQEMFWVVVMGALSHQIPTRSWMPGVHCLRLACRADVFQTLCKQRDSWANSAGQEYPGFSIAL